MDAPDVGKPVPRQQPPPKSLEAMIESTGSRPLPGRQQRERAGPACDVKCPSPQAYGPG
jgi:hypothetical protein